MTLVIGLGANLNDRLATLREAVRRIALVAPVLARSRVWETKPVGGQGDDFDFLNAAVLVEWSQQPIALLDTLMTIEAELGRVRTVRNAPRTIDLDILWIDEGDGKHARIDEPRLVVPHPRLHERAFAIAPLLDVAPHAPYALPPSDGIRLLDAVL